MENLLQFKVPIFLTRGVKKKKNYWLNLNSYRNWKPYLNNDLKIQFKDTVELPELDEPINVPVRILYEFYYPDNRLRDIDNSLAVISKFCGDAMVEKGILVDDDYRYVKSVKGVYGGIDKGNAHCVVTIKEAKNDRSNEERIS